MSSEQITQSDINEYNNRFTVNIDFMTKKNELTFDDFDSILHDFDQYLWDISFNHNYIYIKNILHSSDYTTNSISEITRNMLSLLMYYTKKINKDIKKRDNYLLSITLFNLIKKCIFTIYQYYYISSREYIQQKYNGKSNITDDDCDEALKSIITNFINPDKYPEFQKYNKDNCDNDCVFLLLSNIFILTFNLEFYGINNIKYINDPYNIINKDILNKRLSNKTSNDETDFIFFLKDKLFMCLDKLYKINNNNKIYLNDQYISLPQYTGICWFISFITGITYSDYNKQLLIKKRKEDTEDRELLQLESIITQLENKEYIKTLNHRELLYSLIYYIIDNITNDFKKYSDIDDDNKKCIILKVIKDIPLLFLKALIYETKMLIELDLLEYDETFLDKCTEDQDKMISEKAKVLQVMDKDITKLYPYRFIEKSHNTNISQGIKINEYSIIKLFYSYLNINCLYFYNIDRKFYEITDTRYTNPDVIVIDYNLNNTDIKYDELKENIKKHPNNIINFNDDDTIILNSNTYKLDYILYSSDNFQTCAKCGHAISCIQYNRNQYYHDSGSQITIQNCDDEQMRIACPLIKRDWKTEYNGDYCFKLPKCSFIREYPIYTEVQHHDKEMFIKNSDIDKYSCLCFKSNSNLIKCYVKISSDKDQIQGGRKKKSTSNKDDIKRKVCLDKKTNKYYVNYENKKIYLKT
jgi:hypothetical protein